METTIGIRFNDFALVAADTNAVFSIMLVKNDCDKIHKLSNNLLMAAVGDPGDSVQFAEFIAKNIQLFKIRSGFDLTPENAATYVQRHLADYLRSRTPYQTNLILVGWNKANKEPKLYWIDYLGSMIEIPFGAHGYTRSFITGILDKDYRPDMNEQEGIKLLTNCIKEVQKRFVGSLQHFTVKKLDINGITTLPTISVKDFA